MTAQDARHVPLTTAQKLAQDAAEAAEVRAYLTHPDVVALRIERVRSQVDRMCWAGIVLGLAFTMTNVQGFASAGSPAWSLAWLAAWVLDPTVSLVLLAILRAEQVTARYQVRTGPWVRRAKWLTLVATYVMTLLCLSRRRRGGGLDEGGCGVEGAEELAGDVALEDAADLAVGVALGSSSGDVVASSGAGAPAGENDGVQGAVECAVASAVESVSGGASAAGFEGAGAGEGGKRGFVAAASSVGPGDDGLGCGYRTDAELGDQLGCEVGDDRGEGGGVRGQVGGGVSDACGQASGLGAADGLFAGLAGERDCTGTIGGSRMALGERLVPGSATTTALRDWLRNMWIETCGEHVTLIAVDVSRSMPDEAAASRLSAMTTIAGDLNQVEWADGVTASDRLCLTTFGAGKVKLFWLDDLTEDAVTPLVNHLRPTRGYTSLRSALNSWLIELDRRVRLRRRLDLHFVTDGHLGDRDMEVIHELDAAGHVIHIHIVEGGPTARPELKRYNV